MRVGGGNQNLLKNRSHFLQEAVLFHKYDHLSMAYPQHCEHAIVKINVDHHLPDLLDILVNRA